ncbi:hypothetical protein M5K25_001617 [Dendrobium thyrsiflorum]|uniref:Uncharacterized protein n=1 Tax=Dendrobium thyrsiflorum TaxID=117978 RepID=A0ABD0VR11_DENTH
MTLTTQDFRLAYSGEVLVPNLPFTVFFRFGYLSNDFYLRRPPSISGFTSHGLLASPLNPTTLKRAIVDSRNIGANLTV